VRIGGVTRAAAIALPCATILAGCGASKTTSTGHAAAEVSRDAAARTALVRAGADVLAYGRAHATFDVGGVTGLHRRDPSTALVNFVDGRRTSFFLAVQPPVTKVIWRFDYDHNATSRAECLPGPGRHCRGFRRW